MATTTIIPKNGSRSVTGPVRSLNSVGRRLVLAMLEKIEHGQLIVKDGRMEKTYGHEIPEFAVSATIRVHQADFNRFCAFGGSIGDSNVPIKRPAVVAFRG